MTNPLLESGAAQAIVEGRHGDPFAILGPHPLGKEWVVTAFVPGAAKLMLVPAAKTAKPVEAVPVPDFPGLFQASLPKKIAYRFRATSEGSEWEFEDAYRFGPVLGEMDEYLLGEGTHRRMWQVLTGREDDPEFNHLSDDDRTAILAILRETKAGLPEYWKKK